MFLINLNGIIFGKNARLDVRGSVVVSTASSLNFAGGTRFSVTAPQTVPLLTVNVPQTCTPGSSQSKSEFFVTGRGGLPPSPTEALSSDAIQVDWVTLNPKVENRSSPDVSTNPTSPTPAPIVEAQDWVIDDKGEIVLTASAPSATPNKSWQTPANCHTARNSS